MKRWITVIFVGSLACAAGIGVWTFSRPTSAEPEDAKESAEKTAEVQLATVTRKTIQETVPTFGSVIAEAGRTVSITLPFESVVRRVLVTRGQALDPGEPLVQIAASPATQLQYRQAELTKEATHRELDLTESQYNMKLTTNKDLSQARKAARDAELVLEGLDQQGVNTITELRARSASFVDKVNVQDGQIAAAGTSLVELVGKNDLEAKVGVTPDQAARIQTGQPVILYADPSGSSTPLHGQVRLVSHEVDPATGLVETFVALDRQDQLLIGAYVRGEIEVRTVDALIVPKSAVLPEEDHFSLFSVSGNKAVKHRVSLGIQNPVEVEVISPKLKAGDQVITVGNYELSDGALVETGKPE
jgi:RND family efflux transporter MFP subunit